MRCRYCFYADETALRSVESYGMMDGATLESLVKMGLQHAQRECTFAFQGGEPTLAGLDYYKQLVSLVRRYAPPGLRVHYAIQTNGVLVDEQWASFFHEHGFLVGLSLDGPRDIHDHNRFLPDDSGSFSHVMRAAKLLKANHVQCNILTVVTKQAARHIEKIYRYFVRNEFFHQQYIPCIDPLMEERGTQAYSLVAEDYGNFLIRLFNLWYEDILQGRPVSIRYFDNLISLLAGRVPEMCGVMGQCAIQYVVEADGGVYPCDFYMMDEYRLGNLKTDSLETINEKRYEIGFIEESLPLPDECLRCRWVQLCRGGCRRDRDYAGQPQLGKNYFCEAYQQFFSAVYPLLSHLAKVMYPNL